jgi:drug/metabolite transporter (DMT)-like permease
MLAIASALSKWLVGSYPFGEVLFVRTGISMIVLAAVILPRTGLAVYRTQKLGAHGLRGLSQGTAQVCLILAFSMMPFAATVAINFSAPLFATIAAAIVLREKIGIARWFALMVGFAGVLLVTNPGAEAFQIGALFALGNAVLYGSVTAGVRGMTKTESAETLIIYQMTFLMVMFICLLPLGVRWPASGFDAFLMLGIGLTNAFGQYWWTRSLSLAPASAVTPFYYFFLVWSIGIGYAVWGEMPTVGLIAGSGIVVACGLFLLWYEKRKAAAAPSEPLAE